MAGAELLELLVTRTMPFGKHKGRLIADLPGNYLNWFAREGFPRGEIGRLLALMHELDHNGLTSLLDPLREKPVSARRKTSGSGSRRAASGNSCLDRDSGRMGSGNRGRFPFNFRITG